VCGWLFIFNPAAGTFLRFYLFISILALCCSHSFPQPNTHNENENSLQVIFFYEYNNNDFSRTPYRKYHQETYLEVFLGVFELQRKLIDIFR
jgi:hypothetical protein